MQHISDVAQFRRVASTLRGDPFDHAGYVCVREGVLRDEKIQAIKRAVRIIICW